MKVIDFQHELIEPHRIFFHLFEVENTNFFVLGSAKEFKYKNAFFIAFLSVFNFLFNNIIPTFLEVVIILVVNILIMEMLYKYLTWFNNSVDRKHFFGFIMPFLSITVAIVLMGFLYLL